jgi:FixJ family two-component response regulator
MEVTLNHIGYKTDSYTSSVKALEAYTADPDRYDCIITDQTMPTLTGSELSSRILAEHPHQPIIICSGFSENMNAEKAAQMGIFRFLMKPVSTKALAEVVHDALAAKQSTNRTHTGA